MQPNSLRTIMVRHTYWMFILNFVNVSIMIEPGIIEDIVKRLGKINPATGEKAQSDMDRNMRSILQSMLAKLDLVTRDEFDVQMRLLERTREKLDRLEQEVRLLEKQ
ncbi:MAG: accessory factor UbiK family protein [Gammaproteobacteria bacterium]